MPFAYLPRAHDHRALYKIRICGLTGIKRSLPLRQFYLPKLQLGRGLAAKHVYQQLDL